MGNLCSKKTVINPRTSLTEKNETGSQTRGSQVVRDDTMITGPLEVWAGSAEATNLSSTFIDPSTTRLTAIVEEGETSEEKTLTGRAGPVSSITYSSPPGPAGQSSTPVGPPALGKQKASRNLLKEKKIEYNNGQRPSIRIPPRPRVSIRKQLHAMRLDPEVFLVKATKNVHNHNRKILNLRAGDIYRITCGHQVRTGWWEAEAMHESKKGLIRDDSAELVLNSKEDDTISRLSDSTDGVAAWDRESVSGPNSMWPRWKSTSQVDISEIVDDISEAEGDDEMSSVLEEYLPSVTVQSCEDALDLFYMQRTMDVCETEQKPVLVFDMDETLMTATWDPQAPNFFGKIDMHAMMMFDFDQIDHASLSEGFIALRPGVREMLEKLSEKYVLTLNTAGMHYYAAAVLRLLDPEQKLFGHRVRSRLDPEERNGIKTLADTVEGKVAKNMTIVIDNRVEVWEQRWNENIFNCADYAIWPYGGRPLDEKVLEKDKDTVCVTMTNVLLAIHELYFEHRSKFLENERTLPKIMSHVRRTICSGMNVAFPGFTMTDVHQSPWIGCEYLGGTCSFQASDETTHVFLRRSKEVEFEGLPVISENYFEECFANWHQRDLKQFQARQAKLPPGDAYTWHQLTDVEQHEIRPDCYVRRVLENLRSCKSVSELDSHGSLRSSHDESFAHDFGESPEMKAGWARIIESRKTYDGSCLNIPKEDPSVSSKAGRRSL